MGKDAPDGIVKQVAGPVVVAEKMDGSAMYGMSMTSACAKRPSRVCSAASDVLFPLRGLFSDARVPRTVPVLAPNFSCSSSESL
jgi:hypothetical protein